MAPEIEAERSYSPKAADVFALAVILFVLRARAPPFKNARRTDCLYNLIMSNNSEKFWKQHESQYYEGYFSENFKDFVTSMIRNDPSHRISYSDITYHPWLVSEDCASEKELADEMKARYMDILKRQEQQRLAQSGKPPNH